MNRLIFAGFLGAAIVAAPCLANAVTYAYSGIVDKSSGVYSSAGTTVSGTITINYSAAIPSQSTGTIGSTSADWYAESYGGSGEALPAPPALVFTSTLDSGGVSYSTGSPSVYVLTSDSIHGSSDGAAFSAENQENSTIHSYVQNAILLEGNSAHPVWDSSGLPSFANVTGQNSYLLKVDDGVATSGLVYTITSLTPVPLPASMWLLLGGIGGLGVPFGRKGQGVAA